MVSTRGLVIYGVASLVLVLAAGTFSGLSLGLLSQDVVTLEVMTNASTTTTNSVRKQKCARKILPLVRRHHLLLVTLLLGNAAAVEALPIVLSKLFHPALAVSLSVSLLLVFGEIVPQALCSRFALELGAALHWLVWTTIVIVFPVAWPIARLLDLLFGVENKLLYRTRAELKELVAVHRQLLTPDELLIIRGALDMQQKTAAAVMTPLSSVFELEINHPLDADTLATILQRGHSRIPIFVGDRSNIVAMLLAKSLIGVGVDTQRRVRDLPLRDIPKVEQSAALLDLLNLFQRGASHLAIVTDNSSSSRALGIVTLEDVVEELIGEEIVDETDEYVDVVKRIRVGSRLRGQ